MEAWANLLIHRRSDTLDVDSALLPHIHRLFDTYDQRLVQFRIDDDDCLTHTYVERLRDIAARMDGLGAFSYSKPRGLVTTLYGGERGLWELRQPFHSAGPAVLFGNRDRTAFSLGHFVLGRRFKAFLDNEGFGHFAIKLPDQDSERLDGSERARRDHEPVVQARYDRIIADNFPFLDIARLDELEALVG